MWDFYISRETKFLKRAKTICYGHSSFRKPRKRAHGDIKNSPTNPNLNNELPPLDQPISPMVNANHWRRRSGGTSPPPPPSKSWGRTSGYVPPFLDRANVLISLFAHILWLKRIFFYYNFLCSLRSPTLIRQYFRNFAHLRLENNLSFILL